IQYGPCQQSAPLEHFAVRLQTINSFQLRYHVQFRRETGASLKTHTRRGSSLDEAGICANCKKRWGDYKLRSLQPFILLQNVFLNVMRGVPIRIWLQPDS